MENTEIRKKLMGVEKNDILVIKDLMYQVEKVVDYKLKTASWRNIFCYEPVSKEFVMFELTEGNVILVWRKIEKFAPLLHIRNIAIVAYNDQFGREEIGWPRVIIDGKEDDRVEYSIYISESGKALYLEWWSENNPDVYEFIKDIPLAASGI